MIAGVTIPAVASRFGLKGLNAPGWLASQGIEVPDAPNCIAHWTEDGGGRCLRLGHGEFLVELDGGPVPPASEEVWLLLRSDFCVLLDGPQWPRQLAQVCSFDFQRFSTEPDLVVMTLLAGISVTLARDPRPVDASNPALRLWCDASYSHYLQQCLLHLGEAP